MAAAAPTELDIPDWAHTDADCLQAFEIVVDLPIEDCMFHIQWNTVRATFLDISECQDVQTAIQKIKLLGQKHGALAFVESLELYIKKATIVQSIFETIVHYHLEQSKYYQSKKRMFEMVKNSPTIDFGALPSRQDKIKLVVEESDAQPKKYAIDTTAKDMYAAYWIACHPETAYYTPIKTLHEKATDAMQLIQAWNTVFTQERARECAQEYKTALHTLLMSRNK